MWSKVRKFGLSHCDLPTMIWNVSVFLRLLALNIDNRNSRRIPMYLYVFLAIIVTGYIYVFFISMVWFVFWRCSATGDVLSAIIAFSFSNGTYIGFVKLVFMYPFNNTVKDIVDAYLESDALIEPGSRFAKNTLKTLRVVKKRAMLFWVIVVGNGWAYNLKPVVTPGRHMTEEMFDYIGLEPRLETPNYQIAYTITALSVFFCVYSAANVTGFFIIIAGYTEAQMLALGEELNHLWEDANKQLEDSTNDAYENKDSHIIKQRILNEYVKDKLASILRAHMTNILLIQQFESVFRECIGTEFFFLTVTLVAGLLGGLENTYLQIPFTLMMITMDCWTGQMLTDASIAFQTAVYNCQWENFDKSNMKTVLLMLQISQKDLKLSSGGMLTLNFTCLMSVIRFVYSAYTTLRTAM